MTGRPNDYRIAALEAQLIRAVEGLRWYNHEIPLPARRVPFTRPMEAARLLHFAVMTAVAVILTGKNVFFE